MGFRGNFVRLQDRVSQKSTRTFFPIQSSQESSSSHCFSASNSISSGSRGYYPSSTARNFSGLLFQPVRRSQEGRFGSSSAGLKISQSICTGTTFQDGISQSSNRVHGAERIPFLNRHHRRISACSNCCSSSTFSSFCGGLPTLSVCRSAVRVSDSSASFYKNTCSNSGSTSQQRNHVDSLFGRYFGQSSVFCPKSGQFRDHSEHAFSFRLDNQLQKILPVTHNVSILPRDGVQYKESQSHSSQGKTGSAPPEDQTSNEEEIIHPYSNESFGGHGIFYGSHSFCSVSHSSASKGNSHVMGQEEFFSGSCNVNYTPSLQRTPMVASLSSGEPGKIFSSNRMDDHNNGCKSTGLGSSVCPSYSSGNLVSKGIMSSHQCFGTSSNFLFADTLVSTVKGSADSNSNRQCYSSGISEPSGRHAQLGIDERVIQNPAMGRETCSGSVSGFYSRSGELDGRLSQQRESGSRRMVSPSTSIQRPVSTMGSSRRGFNGIQKQLQGPNLYFSDARPSGVRGGRSCGSLAEFSAPLCVPTNSASIPSPSEDQEGRHSGNSNCSRLAAEALVCRSHRSTSRRPMAASASQRSIVAGNEFSPEFKVATFDGMAVESAILRAHGFEEDVIRTMISARKPVSTKVYYRVWRSYFQWCEERSFSSREFSLSRILSFLQSGLNLGLALSTLKGQISALSILFQKSLASEDAVRTFFQGVAHIVPPYRSPVTPWDLNLVLSVLQEDPFEPLEDISLRHLFWKVAFLVAITSLRRVSEIAALSCKDPFLILHQDKVVLRPPPEFLPKVVSKFHINEDIVLPSFCPSPSHPKEKALHSLDVVRAIRKYLSVSAAFRRSDSLFIIPEGPRKGQAASKATIARWIRLTIVEAYRLRGKSSPIRVVAHSTRAVGASWAMHHQASASQLCKAATWSSLHTFTKFYRVHTFASADASVGRKVLQAAVS